MHKLKKFLIIGIYDISIGLMYFSIVIFYKCLSVGKPELFIKLFSDTFDSFILLIALVAVIIEIAIQIASKIEKTTSIFKIRIYMTLSVLATSPVYLLYLWFKK